MDLNYFLARHQTELVRATGAASVEARHAHRRLAAAYARQIDLFQSGIGGTTAPLEIVRA